MAGSTQGELCILYGFAVGWKVPTCSVTSRLQFDRRIACKIVQYGLLPWQRAVEKCYGPLSWQRAVDRRGQRWKDVWKQQSSIRIWAGTRLHPHAGLLVWSFDVSRRIQLDHSQSTKLVNTLRPDFWYAKLHCKPSSYLLFVERFCRVHWCRFEIKIHKVWLSEGDARVAIRECQRYQLLVVLFAWLGTDDLASAQQWYARFSAFFWLSVWVYSLSKLALRRETK